jgi:hypothetical protein
MQDHTKQLKTHAILRIMAILGMVFGMFGPLAQTAPAYASTVRSATFTGGVGTTSAGGILYAKNGGALTLTVATSSDTKCVDVTGAFTGHQTSSTAKSSWTFSFTAGTGDGVQTVTAAASPNFNANNCTGQSQSPQSASFVLDNTGPVVTAALSPAANADGWNNSNVSITWSANDVGSGVASGPTPSTDSQQQSTAGVTKTSTATDRLGNVGNGSVTVKLDKGAPTITGSRSPAANANGWNNTDVMVSFTCSDSPAGIKSCSGSTTLTSSAANQSVTGTAVDNADNSATATVSGINIDKVAPTLSGAPTTSANAAGWYNGNVTIHWTANDGLSGVVATPSDSTISSEGTGLTASASVSDKAGNSINATSSPAVNIDKTAPNTTATAPANWNNTDVTVSLNPSDALSGIAATNYTLDGGTQQSGTSVAISAEGIHTLQFWSVDKAGNAETAKSVQVKIDKTPPTINHTQSPAANANGWNNTNVTVTFSCADSSGSGIANCTAAQTVATEGQNQAVTGTATDNAGNTAIDPATVSIDKTAPTISAAADRAPNANGWYNADVTVSFTCGDALSGIDTCPASQMLGEGANQSANGTATDAAGNTKSASVSGISVDETAPSLSGATTTSPNANGWYSGDVMVHWTASDALSGLDGSTPSDSTITGEGNDLSASAMVSDLAGNGASKTVSGIKIDRTAPSTLASVPAPLASGWYAGDVEVTLTTGADLSGIDETYYQVGNGTPQVYGGPFTISTKGISTITFWSVDKAANVEDNTAGGHSITLKIDGVPPTITGSRTPVANGFGWNNAPVTVSFNCSDAESGIAGCSDPVTLSGAGEAQSVTGQAQDNAGNTAEVTVSDINIDLTAPTLTGAATTNPNAFGWYKGDVTIHWTGQDGLSGIDPATQPTDSVIAGEGSNLGAGPVSISDQAGNVGSGSVSGIKIDRTAPTIGGATVNDDGTARSANGAGWFNSAVRVRFTCSDAGSGVQECAGDKVLDQNGAGQTASGTATDKADNSASTTVSGISIDSQAPQTSANNQCDSKNGWCKGQTATVVLTAADQAGLSGVKEIHYTVNGGQEKVANGASVSVNVPLAAKSGLATVEYFAVDNAGNVEAKSGVSLKYDNIAPAVTHTVNPAANAGGWNNASVTVHFDATDDDGGSGVDPSTVTADQTISAETAGTVVNGSASDLAGNLGTDSVTVKLDKTAPTISGAATTSPNSNGWYNGPVTVHFTCADQGAVQSGIATCPADVVLSTDGANQSIPGTATDKADNTASTTVTGINIDSIKPDISLNGIANGGIYTLGAVPMATCTASDGDSGVASCKVTVTGGQPNGVGSFSFSATATDKAGNTTTQPGSYKVIYRWDGFQQPINDTAHQIDQAVSIFKGGSTVPVKFQLKKADGTVVQANSLPQWLNPAKGSPTTASVDEIVYSDPATAGGTYKWDSTAQQYAYNWSTKGSTVGYFYRVGVTLDDGQTYYVNLGLR